MLAELCGRDARGPSEEVMSTADQLVIHQSVVAVVFNYDVHAGS
jgi:hypothetical protein